MSLSSASPELPRAVPLRPAATPADRHLAAERRPYRVVLTWAFTLFSSIRVLTYLPTLWVLVASGQSEQHSLWTWGLWACSNVTMAAWLYEEAGQRWSRAVTVNAVNASMCMAVFVVIAALRM
jgi:hypothetical protein